MAETKEPAEIVRADNDVEEEEEDEDDCGVFNNVVKVVAATAAEPDVDVTFHAIVVHVLPADPEDCDGSIMNAPHGFTVEGTVMTGGGATGFNAAVMEMDCAVLFCKNTQSLGFVKTAQLARTLFAINVNVSPATTVAVEDTKRNDTVVVFNHVHMAPGAEGNVKINEQPHALLSPNPASLVLVSNVTNKRRPESPKITRDNLGAGMVAAEYASTLNGLYDTL